MEAMQAAQTRQQVAALYQAHALGLVKLAVLMVGDQRAAEDVVQDAFLGLYRRWSALQDREKALSYVRASVLNGCRTIHRGKYRRSRIRLEDPGHAESAEAIAMLGEAHREVLAALRRLPDRQREAVVLRYYLDMTEDQAAQAMGVAVRQFGASAPAVGGPASNLPATVPRYYVALSLKGTGPNGYEGSGDLTVGDDHTGTAIATITPPDGVGFYDVQGASDDRTFVVMATSGKHFWPTGPESWYLL